MRARVFFTAPVPAQLARRLGAGLPRTAMAIGGKVNLASYDRLDLTDERASGTTQADY